MKGGREEDHSTTTTHCGLAGVLILNVFRESVEVKMLNLEISGFCSRGEL